MYIRVWNYAIIVPIRIISDVLPEFLFFSDGIIHLL